MFTFRGQREKHIYMLLMMMRCERNKMEKPRDIKRNGNGANKKGKR